MREDLAVCCVFGGTDARTINFSGLACGAGETINMCGDQDSTFDHFLIIPLDNGEKLMVCVDAKFSVDGRKQHLNFRKGYHLEPSKRLAYFGPYCVKSQDRR